MNSLKDENYAVIQGWMITKLGLKGNELLLYAIIFGFSQAEGQAFSGSLRYLAEWLNTSKRTVMDNLKSLVEKDLLEKEESFTNGVKFCAYRCKNFTGVWKNLHRGMEDSSMGGMEKTSPNNKYIDNKYINNIKERATSRFSRPSLEEVRAYCEERGNNVDPEHFIDYYNANGWKVGKNSMKDWKAAVRNWEKRTGQYAGGGKSGQPLDKATKNIDPEYEAYLKGLEDRGAQG